MFNLGSTSLCPITDIPRKYHKGKILRRAVKVDVQEVECHLLRMKY